MYHLGEEPLQFIVKFLAADAARIGLVAYWLAVVCASIAWFPRLESWLGLRVILSRKLYHFLITAVAVPGAFADSAFLSLALCGALSLFVVAEVIRVCRVPPIGPVLDAYMSRYIDKRDAGDVILTHIYLLLGCALPFWLHAPFEPLVPGLAGIISLGIADSAASFVGIRFGTVNWPGSRKTLQGSLGAAVTSALSIVALQSMASPIPVATHSLLQPVAFNTLLEASTDQIDNLFLPLYFYAAIVSVL